MTSLLIVTGPPGAGKSSVARVLADTSERSVLVEGDAFFAFLASGAIEPWLPASNDQNTVVTRAAASTAGAFAAGGYATFYDGVVGPWFLPTFAAATGLDRLDYVILFPPKTPACGASQHVEVTASPMNRPRGRCTQSSLAAALRIVTCCMTHPATPAPSSGSSRLLALAVI